MISAQPDTYLGLLYTQNRILPGDYLRADRTLSLRGDTPISDTAYRAFLDDPEEDGE